MTSEGIGNWPGAFFRDDDSTSADDEIREVSKDDEIEQILNEPLPEGEYVNDSILYKDKLSPSVFLFSLAHAISFTLPLLLSCSRSNLKATTLPLRRSNLLSRYPSHSSSSSLSLKSPSHSSSSSSLCCFATTPPLRLSVATTPLLRRRHISFNASESHGCLPPRNPNPTTNRHPTGRDLTPPADAISNLVLFVDRLVPQSGGSE
ncbi:hypothetical protein VIGAN_01137400 [Vigna angularis var. angularis]|uniref:Uncharacterized protein n=1 Tax=Vigna angularis var. angularis TaxID=157739 RepID=A0A0S3QZQ3_PHAAN|nr:hypothetical protein VIGAN_01137400 [Vigna angularis var. angularis]